MDHRAAPRVAYPDAIVGVCKHCGRPCDPHRRTHDGCALRHFEATDYREAARRREGEKQRCIDCGMVEGQSRRVEGDYPGGWKWERVVIQRDHPQELIDNGPRDWTVPRCKRCHVEKTNRERARRQEKTMDGRPFPARAMFGAWCFTEAATWYLVKPTDYAAFAWGAAIGLAIFAALFVWVWRVLRRRDEVLRRLGDTIARATHTDPSRIKIRIRRWRAWAPVRASVRYSSLFDDSEGSPGRDAFEALVSRKVGQPLTFRWTPHRDTVSWWPLVTRADAEGPLPLPADPVAAEPSRADVASRLTLGLAAALGTAVDVEVTAWHARNVPQSFRVTFPASARVHEDKVQDAVEDKVATLLPGTWRAEWRTTTDEVVFTDTPDPLAPVVNAPPLPEHVDLARLPMGLREDGKPWTVRLTQTHVLIGGASGAGKGSVLWSLLRALLPGIIDGTVEAWGLDPKAMELVKGRGMFARFAIENDDMLALLNRAVDYMKARARTYGQAGVRDHVPSPKTPTLVVVIDELASLTKYAGDRKYREQVNAALGMLLSQGRAVGVTVVGALQDPRKDVLTLRDLFGTRIALRLTEPTAVDMLLGAGARAAGARADRIAVEQQGTGYVMVDGSPTPERFRAAWISNDAIEDMVAAVKAPAPAFEWVDLDDLVEGDRIEVDGETGEFIGAVEQGNGMVEVEWKRALAGVVVPLLMELDEDTTVKRLPPPR